MFLSDEGPTFKTLDFAFYIGSTPTFLYRFLSQHCQRSTLHFMFLSDEGPTFKTSDFIFYIGSTPTFLYFDLYFNTAYAALYILCRSLTKGLRSKRKTSLSISAVQQPFLYFDFYFNTANAAHYILCFSLAKGQRSKR